MSKTILITGSTDGIGLETARDLAAKGHRVLLHGRNPAQLEAAASGRYFDNDSGRFADPHPDGLDHRKSENIVHLIEEIILRSGSAAE